MSYLGGSQDWYTDFWQQRSGCGPTTAALLVWYLSQANPAFSHLYDVGNGDKASFLKLMQEMFRYITPTRRGVNTSKIFVEGAKRFCLKRGIDINPSVLDVTAFNMLGTRVLQNFLCECFRKDLPVAFLNLSRGALKNLDNWHWVAITEFEPDIMHATMCDQGFSVDIDIGLWITTSKLGGAFVALG